MKFLRFLFIIFLICSPQEFLGQNSSEAEQLKKDLKAESSVKEEIIIIRQIMAAEQSPDSIIKYSGMLIEKGKTASDEDAVRQGHHTRGVRWGRLAEFDKALQDLFEAARLAEEANDLTAIGNINVEIGNVYSESGNNKLAATYFDRGIDAIRKNGNRLSLGMSLFNVGDDLYEKDQLDSALTYTVEARQIFKDYKRPVFEAYAIGNLGRIYLEKGEMDNVEKYLKTAIEVLEEVPDYNALADFYCAMADFYRKKKDFSQAIEYAQKSLAAAEHDNMKNEQATAHQLLSNLYSENGDVGASFDHYKMFVAINDSVRNVSTVQEMANLRSSFEIARKQKEVDLLNQQKRNQKTIVIATIVALVLIILLAFGLYRRNKYIGKTKKIIENEKNRSELLLLNILPQETASELKENGKVQAKRFDAVSILFTDFKNFTHYAENLSPEELVKSVDFYFSEFDRIVEKHGLEKIKTVGDSYMCAAGVPFPVEDHAKRIVLAACDMMDFVRKSRRLESQKETRFELRIGINSGPVVAGVVGSKKFAYDIWGDAVNIASRMETTGEIDHINISEFTYDLVKKDFDCTFRGEIHVKNKGMMKMYFVNCPESTSPTTT